MAYRKKTEYYVNKTSDSGREKSGTKQPWWVIFWIGFLVVIIGLFAINQDAIIRTLQEAGYWGIPAEQQTRLPPSQSFSHESELIPELALNPEIPGTLDLPAVTDETYGTALDDAMFNEDLIQESSLLQISPPVTTPEYRERTLYFINVDMDGTIVRTRVNRSLPSTDTPLTDVLGALIAGPVPEEQRLGLISLIPEDTRIMSATIRGYTAYISFSEDFQYNIYGVEGYVGAVRQVVWTATEFPNVRDVQILIENRRLEFLGEGVWIGSPLSRAML